MSLKQKTIQSLFWSALQNWGSQVGSLIVFLVLARLLTPEAFGLVALANVFINFMQIFLDQGLGLALVQRQDLEPEHLDTAFWTQIASSIILILITFMSSGVIADSFKQPQLKLLLSVLSIVFILNALNFVQRAILKRNFNFQSLAIRSLIGIIVCGLVGVMMALNGFGVWSLVGQQLAYEFVGVIVLWKASDWRPRLKFSSQHFWQLYHFSIHLLTFQLLSFFNHRTDNLLIGYYFGETALGYYAIARRILEVMVQLVAETINQVALSTFSRLQNDFQRFCQVFYQATQLTSLIAVPTFLGVILLAPELVELLFGQKWLPSVPILQIITFAGILRSLSMFNESVLMSLNKPSWRFRLGLLNASLNIIGCLIAVQWGIIAVSFVYVISEFIIFPVGFWAIHKLIPVSLVRYSQQFIVTIVASLIMILVILLTKHFMNDFPQTLLVLAFSTFLGVIAYGLSVRLFAPAMSQKLIGLVNLVGAKSPKT